MAPPSVDTAESTDALALWVHCGYGEFVRQLLIPTVHQPITDIATKGQTVTITADTTHTTHDAELWEPSDELFTPPAEVPAIAVGDRVRVVKDEIDDEPDFPGRVKQVGREGVVRIIQQPGDWPSVSVLLDGDEITSMWREDELEVIAEVAR